MSPVKTQKRPKRGPIGDRLAVLLDLFSPWDGISLTYRQLARELGKPVTEAAVKKWPQRAKFPPDVARLIVAKARDRGLVGMTLDWVLWGDGARPHKATKGAPKRPVAPQAPAERRAREALSVPEPPHEPHGRFAAGIGEALQADLSSNEFGQWSSVEVQHTVIWALKDLARRLRALRFDMGRTFELTDEWAGRIGLPVRQSGSSSEDGAEAPRT